jgi:phospholipase C
MTNETTRRGLFKGAMTAAAFAALPPSIQKALAIPAAVNDGTIEDVKHVVILMQENRSFDQYFGTKFGVRGFGDPHPQPTVSGQPVWYQKNSPSASATTTLPFPMLQSSNWALAPSHPHGIDTQQGAWGQGQASYWPLYKSAGCMGFYSRAEVPFHFALAEAFTLGDDYHCAMNGGTDMNRMCMMSGSCWDPVLAAEGIPSTDATSEPQELRSWITGTWPVPGYTYNGPSGTTPNQPVTWPNVADVLTAEGITWRVYQDMNDNWTGAMNGFLAFKSFRTAQPGSTIYQNGMTTHTVADLKTAVQSDALSTVSFVLPGRLTSEHPGAPCSPTHGGFFTETVLEALTSNPEVWAKTVFILNYDENDGYFDHALNPAIPSYDINGNLQGKTTMPTKGLYFNNATRIYSPASYLSPLDTISGNLRPWGMGFRVPFVIASPWSRGGWINSEVADHISVPIFLEKWLGITFPAISDWHRSVCSDLTSFFNFRTPNDDFPDLPDLSGYAASDAASSALPPVQPPANQTLPTQETGFARSRALPYDLTVEDRFNENGTITLEFINKGDKGAVFHVYDYYNLDRIPRRYTVEAGKRLSDDAWDTFAPVNFVAKAPGLYNLWVYGPNGFVRQFKGTFGKGGKLGLSHPTTRLSYDKKNTGIHLTLHNNADEALEFAVKDNAYGAPPQTVSVASNETATLFWSVKDSGNWYDFSVTASDGLLRKCAGRMEDGQDHITDPQMGGPVAPYYDEPVTIAQLAQV